MGATSSACSSAERGARAGAISSGDESGAPVKKDAASAHWYDKMRLSAASQTVFEGAQCGDARRVLNALNAHGDPNCVNFSGYTPLLVAVGGGPHPGLKNKGGYREVIALLLQASSNPNHGILGVTPLMVASASGQLEVARMLVNCGATSTSADKQTGMTALHRAASRGHGEVAGLLVQAGALVDVADWKGLTPLMYAVTAGHTDVARALLCAGANLALTDELGENVLHKAITANRESCVDLLLKAGAPVNAGSQNTGDTPLLIATRVSADGLCRRLVQFAANVNLANHMRETPLMASADKGHAKIAHMLLLAGADTTFTDIDGYTALMRASLAGHAQFCSLALDFGANPSYVSAVDCETPLSLAARNGQTEAYKIIVSAGGAVRATEDDSELRPKPARAA